MAEISSSASSSSLASLSALASAAAAVADVCRPGLPEPAPSVVPNMTWDPRLPGSCLDGDDAMLFFSDTNSSSRASLCCAESRCLCHTSWLCLCRWYTCSAGLSVQQSCHGMSGVKYLWSQVICSDFDHLLCHAASRLGMQPDAQQALLICISNELHPLDADCAAAEQQHHMLQWFK